MSRPPQQPNRRIVQCRHYLRDVATAHLRPIFPSCLRAATFVDKVPKGAPPGGLPVEQLRDFELVLNLKTAQALDITVPSTLLILADEVIK